MSFNGVNYESLIDGNSYSPSAMCPSPHYVVCACGVRWWRLCNETDDDFARRVRQFPPCCPNYAPPA